jgi:hypothetical protein
MKAQFQLLPFRILHKREVTGFAGDAHSQELEPIGFETSFHLFD